MKYVVYDKPIDLFRHSWGFYSAYKVLMTEEHNPHIGDHGLVAMHLSMLASELMLKSLIKKLCKYGPAVHELDILYRHLPRNERFALDKLWLRDFHRVERAIAILPPEIVVNVEEQKTLGNFLVASRPYFDLTRYPWDVKKAGDFFFISPLPDIIFEHIETSHPDLMGRE